MLILYSKVPVTGMEAEVWMIPILRSNLDEVINSQLKHVNEMLNEANQEIERLNKANGKLSKENEQLKYKERVM